MNRKLQWSHHKREKKKIISKLLLRLAAHDGLMRRRDAAQDTHHPRSTTHVVVIITWDFSVFICRICSQVWVSWKTSVGAGGGSAGCDHDAVGNKKKSNDDKKNNLFLDWVGGKKKRETQSTCSSPLQERADVSKRGAAVARVQQLCGRTRLANVIQRRRRRITHTLGGSTCISEHHEDWLITFYCHYSYLNLSWDTRFLNLEEIPTKGHKMTTYKTKPELKHQTKYNIRHIMCHTK